MLLTVYFFLCFLCYQLRTSSTGQPKLCCNNINSVLFWFRNDLPHSPGSCSFYTSVHSSAEAVSGTVSLSPSHPTNSLSQLHSSLYICKNEHCNLNTYTSQLLFLYSHQTQQFQANPGTCLFSLLEVVCKPSIENLWGSRFLLISVYPLPTFLHCRLRT